MTKRTTAVSLLLWAACTSPGKTVEEPSGPVTALPAGPQKKPPKKPPKPQKKPHEAFLDQCKEGIAAAKAKRDAIVAGKPGASALETSNGLDTDLYNAAGRAELISEVHPDEEMRTAAETCTQEVQRTITDLNLDRPFFDAISAIPQDGLDAESKRYLEHTLRDFRREGVDKDEEVRKRLKELGEQETLLSQEISRNVRDDVRKLEFDPAQLKGLPKDYIDKHKPGENGKVTITTDYPDYFPFRSYADDTAARKALYIEFTNRGWPKNDEPWKKLFEIRREKATLLGYPTYADYITETKMIKSAKNAQQFIDKITKAADKRAKKDYAELLKRKKKADKKAKRVEDFEKAYYEEKVKAEKYAFDSQAIRKYLEFTTVKNGLLGLTSKLFDIEYRPVKDAYVWHPSVEVYDVYRGSEKLGRIYLDLHPRDGKFKHAAQFPLQSGVAGKQLPEGALVCNFPDPKDPPALMEHDDVATMFHEFGHLMHHVLGGHQKYIRFSGVATEHDFVEAPSQMLEEWAFDYSVLKQFAKHYETGEVIPEALVKKLVTANNFGKGTQTRQQMFYAALSLQAHLRDPAKLDMLALQKEMQKKYAMFPYVEGTHFYANFDHMTGYSAVYYTYMWSLVLAKDLWSAFEKNKNVLDPALAQKYRDAVLVPGGSKDAADLVKDFLGRPHSFKAFEKWLNKG